MQSKKKFSPKKGLVVVISGPSGVGKSTVVKSLLQRASFIKLSISYSTRPARKGEVEGKDYFFIKMEEFLEKVSKKEFLEWAKVHGHYYGTEQTFVDNELAKNHVVVLEVDVQGAERIREMIRQGEWRVPSAVFVFLIPPSVSILSSRLEGRKTETQEAIDHRLRAAMGELQVMEKYDYIVVNEEVASAAKKIEAIIRVELERKMLN